MVGKSVQKLIELANDIEGEVVDSCIQIIDTNISKSNILVRQ